MGNDVGGVAVHAAARIMAMAGASEVFASALTNEKMPASHKKRVADLEAIEALPAGVAARSHRRREHVMGQLDPLDTVAGLDAQHPLRGFEQPVINLRQTDADPFFLEALNRAVRIK